MPPDMLTSRRTAAVQAALVRDGVHGLVLLGTVGENNSLSARKKRAVLAGAVETVRGQVPSLRGVRVHDAGAAAYARMRSALASAVSWCFRMVYVRRLRNWNNIFAQLRRRLRYPSCSTTSAAIASISN